MENKNNEDAGLMTVLVERFKKQRYPRAISLLEKVERGEFLSSVDLMFLKEVSDDINKIQSLLDRHSECLILATQMINLCKDIAVTDLNNQTKI